MTRGGGTAGCTTKKKPRFFKVFFPGLSCKQLEISPAFRKHMRLKRSASTCFLTGPSGKAWRVDMIKNEKGVFFQNGWEEFVRDHALQTGEFLIFEYEGSSRFSVLVFDASMCEKESAFGAPAARRGLAGSAEGSRSREKAKQDGGPKAERKPPRKRYTGVWVSQRRPVTGVEIRKAHQAAFAFKSTNPSVVLVMRKYDVYFGHMMRVPRSFSRQHLAANKKLTFWDPVGMPWTVNYISNNGRYFFSGGWRKFALANYLEQDDACAFELIQPNEFRVHIFRVVEEIRPLTRKVGF